MTGTCWWCGRPAMTALPAYLDGQIISISLCPVCFDNTAKLWTGGAVDVLDLRDALAFQGEPEPVTLVGDLGPKR